MIPPVRGAKPAPASECIVDVRALYDGTARVSELAAYEAKARAIAGEGNVVILTGKGPIWLYLRLAHALHGLARRVIYRAPESGDVVIFDHDSSGESRFDAKK